MNSKEIRELTLLLKSGELSEKEMQDLLAALSEEDYAALDKDLDFLNKQERLANILAESDKKAADERRRKRELEYELDLELTRINGESNERTS